VNKASNAARNVDDAAVVRTATELATLVEMTGAEMAEKYLALFGQPARSRNKDFLRKRLAWRIQELAEGGLSERALTRIEELGSAGLAAARRPVRVRTTTSPIPRPPGAARDPRLPPAGTVVRRVRGTTEHNVTILDEDFEYRGEKYGSLSKIARVITGTPWNGYLFFFSRANGTKSGPRAQGR
jgi:hypothetical protein